MLSNAPMRAIVLAMLLLITPLSGRSAPVTADSASILVYHHVDEDTPASTSVSPATFASHLDYLSSHHKVLPLKHIVDAIKAGRPLPNKAAAITFDDGYANIFHNAHPLLSGAGMPYTVFINPALIGQGNQLSWAQIALMSQQGATFANHSSEHRHLLARHKGEDQAQWLARTLKDIQQAEDMIQAKLGYSLKYLAYPYGEFSPELGRALVDRGYVGFGQHSGAVARHSDLAALPRFAAAGRYANLDTLSVKLSSLALPIEDQQSMALAFATRTVSWGFTLQADDFYADALQCYFNGDPIGLLREGNHYSVETPLAIPVGRSRVNCTAPSKRYKGRYYWYSRPFVRPDAEGVYLD